MADIRLAKPAAGAAETVPCAPEARFVFDFPTSDATLARDGDNLNISFQDGSRLQLQDFYKEYNEENLPSFSVDGTDVAAADFFNAMNEPDLMPAAGPTAGTVANGARFHEWDGSDLTGGIEHLNGLDWGFSRAFEWEDHPNAVGYHHDDEGDWQGVPVDHPVTITPENPGSVPPGTVVPPDGPENSTPPAPGTPGNSGIVPPGDVRLVSESGLRGGDSVSVNGAMRVSAPDGLASIEIAGRAIWQNGHMVGNPEFHTDEGYFHNFAYDAAAGRLTYTYTLTEATQEHKLPRADHIAHSLPLTVRDMDGDSASSNITIIIRDDVPVLKSVDDPALPADGRDLISYTQADYKTHITFTGTGWNQKAFADTNKEGGGLEQTWTAVPSIKRVDWEGGKAGAVNNEQTDKQDFWFASSDHDESHQTYIATTHDGTIQMTPTFVHYKYVMQGTGPVKVDHVVDITNSIPRSAKALYLTGEGLTVGAVTGVKTGEGAYSGKSIAWNDTTGKEIANDQISVGSGKNTLNEAEGTLHMPSGSGSNGLQNFLNAYGENRFLDNHNGIDADNVSEAIVFDTQNGLISYGFDIGLGKFEGDDRVLLTFLMTPAHSSDDSIVKMVVLTPKMEDTNGVTNIGEELYRIEVPDGFTKVMVSALPGLKDYKVDDDGFSAESSAGGESSGFTIKEVDFLAATYTSNGRVTGTSADGMASYDWNFDNIPAGGSKVVFVKGAGGGDYAVEKGITVAPDGDKITYTFTLSGGDQDGQNLNGQPLFTATINTKTGVWSVTHYREFDMKDGTTPFQITGTDRDGDTDTIKLVITPEFMRFSNVVEGFYNEGWGYQNVLDKDKSDDILVGNDNNTLMYGKGGNDLLIGDEYDHKVSDPGEDVVGKLANQILGYEATNPLTKPEEDLYRDLNDVNEEGKETFTNTNKETFVVDGKHITAVDDLYAKISELKAHEKKALGEKLEAHEKTTHGNDALYGGGDDDLLFGAGGDDFLSGELGKDIIYGGGGKDIILYDQKDLYIDGGKGIDILVAGSKTVDGSETPTLADLLTNETASEEHGPVVRNVELLLKYGGDFTSSLEVSSQKSLSDRYGITISENGVDLSPNWTYDREENGSLFYTYKEEMLTLEVRKVDDKGNDILGTRPQPPTGNDIQRAAGIASQVGLLTALAAANGVEAAPVREDEGAGAAQDAQGADGGLDVAALSYAEAEANAPEDAQAGAGEQAGFETLIAGLGEVTPAMLDGAAEARDIRYTTMDTDSEARPADTAAPDAAGHRAAGEGAASAAQGHGGDLPDGVEAIRTGAGDDFIDAGAGSHAIYAGAGDDLIVYDAMDYLIDGGEGIDFLLAGDAQASLGQLLTQGNGENGMPIVNNVEVLLKGVDTASLTSMDKLAEKFGLTLEKGLDGQDRLMVDKSQWDAGDGPDANGVTTWTNTADASITMETTLQQTSEAEGQVVLTAKVAAETGGNN